MEEYVVHTDGGARGNPGPAGAGALIKKLKYGKSKKVAEISDYLGETTNNIAEYTAAARALDIIKENAKLPVKVRIYLDSELIVRQMSGEYKVKNEGLKSLFNQIREIIIELGGDVSFTHIPREQNKEADKLVNLAIDNGLINEQK